MTRRWCLSAAVLACLATACAPRANVPQAPSNSPAVALSPPPRPGNPWSDLTRDILVQHCGQCHRSDLPTRVPRALAVFDLLEDPWFGHLTGEQLDDLGKRVSGVRDLPPADARTVASFVRCARSGECDATEETP